MEENFDLIRAQADLHQQYFIGLQLMVSTREGPAAVREWMFHLFRRGQLYRQAQYRDTSVPLLFV